MTRSALYWKPSVFPDLTIMFVVLGAKPELGDWLRDVLDAMRARLPKLNQIALGPQRETERSNSAKRLGCSAEHARGR